MVTVCETWHLKAEYADRALELMQEMDELVGPPAHEDPAWSGHASFFQSQADPSTVLMMYTWRSVPEHQSLAASEQSLLADFYAQYCTAPRDIAYYTELPVDVDHDDEHDHHHEPVRSTHG
ncbi:hypothetical protein AB0M36_02030 [Actinoplanes sp. NPDC051346]|uniref:hypothetical protein n=1 Tax=Actinoplanes sp. NPDC051346 TaxID=3155048 RepID=UPI003427C92A